MPREPWDITPEMYLRPDEAERLLRHVRDRAEFETGERRAGGGAGHGRLTTAVRGILGGEEIASAAQDRLIIEVLLFSGLRTSEFCRLCVSDVPPALGQPALRIRGDEGGRLVWLPSHIAALLSEFVRRHRPRLLGGGGLSGDREPPLIVNERGRPFDRTALYRRVVRILSGAGLGDRASVQLLRHTYGYLAYLRTGGNLLFVQRQLGHAHPMVTSVYAKLVVEDYAGLAERVAGQSGDAPDSRQPRRSETRAARFAADED